MKTKFIKEAFIFLLMIGISSASLVMAQTDQSVSSKKDEVKQAAIYKDAEPDLNFSDPTQRKPDGDGKVVISGELKQWHMKIGS